MKNNENFSISDLKIAFIYGKRPIDSVQKNGELEKIYKYDDDMFHYYYMKNFLQDNMKDEKELQSLLDNPYKNSINSLAYQIQKLGHIVFLENTSHPSYKSGIMYMPKNISDKQIETLKMFSDKLKHEDYNITELSNLFRDKEGILNGSQRIGKADILDYLLEREDNIR